MAARLPLPLARSTAAQPPIVYKGTAGGDNRRGAPIPAAGRRARHAATNQILSGGSRRREGR